MKDEDEVCSGIDAVAGGKGKRLIALGSAYLYLNF